MLSGKVSLFTARVVAGKGDVITYWLVGEDEQRQARRRQNISKMRQQQQQQQQQLR